MLPELQSEEQLAAVEAASVPHMGAGDQRDIVRRLQQRLRREPAAAATVDGLAALGINVRRQP